MINISGFTEEQSPNYDLHFAVALTKNMDRTEWFIEKANEVGVTEITFIHSQNSERTKINEDRIHRILVAAMKQSKRTYLPKFIWLLSFSDFLKGHNN